MEVPSARNSDKDSISPILLGNLLIFEQPQILRNQRDFTWQMLLGIVGSLLQSFKFSKTSSLRSPIDWCTSFNATQSSKISSSILGIVEKCGVLVSRCE